MTKVDEIMELVHARDCTISYAESWDQGPAWKVSEVRKALLKADSDLRTAIESLEKDAEQWRAYKARRDAVIAAGMGRNALRR